MMPLKKALLLLLVISLLCHDAKAATCSQVCHYVPWARDADCSRRRFQHIPVECIDSKVLNLNRNNISVVPPGVFSGFNNLKYLQLLQNAIHSIYPNAFAGARRLKSVNMLKNSLTNLTAHAFNDTNSLRWLYLSKNQIKLIEYGVFQESPLIETLYLDENHLDHLDKDVFQDLSKLQRLLLGNNQLTTIPKGIFKDLASLTYLDLSDNQLQILLSVTFSGLDNLETVKLAGNRLVNIVGGTFSVKYLRNLDVSRNNLTTLNLFEDDVAGMSDLKAEGNPWVCNCSLEFLRLTLINLSAAHTDSPLCAGPQFMAHADIKSLSTLCPPTTATSEFLTSQKTEPMVTKAIKYSQHQMTDKLGAEEGVDESPVDKLSPEIITLISVGVVTCVAILCMVTFLYFVLSFSRRQQNNVVSKSKQIENGLHGQKI